MTTQQKNDLSSVFPLDLVEGKFSKPLAYTVLTKKDLDKMEVLKPHDMFQIGITAWDKFCNANPQQNKMIFNNECARNDPKLYKKVRRTIDEVVIKDLFYLGASVQDPTLKKNNAVEFILAHIYPNSLMIVDVMLIDPYSPIVPQKYDHQEFKGLGIFPAILGNIKSYCEENNISEICLTAADIPLKNFFEKHGFYVPDTWMGRESMKHGLGIPMVMDI